MISYSCYINSFVTQIIAMAFMFDMNTNLTITVTVNYAFIYRNSSYSICIMAINIIYEHKRMQTL